MTIRCYRIIILIDAGIHDGEIVIASVNNELTVKRLRCRRGKVQLVPANPAMEPINVEMEDDFRIFGVVLNECCLGGCNIDD